MEAAKVTFFASYYEAAKMLPEYERGDFVMGVLAYAFEGIEPVFDGTCAVAWALMKPNIDESVKRSRTNKANATRSTAKATAPRCDTAAAEATDGATAKATALATAEATVSYGKDMDKDKDRDKESEEERNAREAARFGADVLAIWNEETGQSLLDLSGKTWCRLNRIRESGRTLDDVRSVIRAKRQEWANDPRMASALKPATVLGDHFEEYLGNARGCSHDAAFAEFAGL